jgi:hypothetical protein
MSLKSLRISHSNLIMNVSYKTCYKQMIDYIKAFDPVVDRVFTIEEASAIIHGLIRENLELKAHIAKINERITKIDARKIRHPNKSQACIDYLNSHPSLQVLPSLSMWIKRSLLVSQDDFIRLKDYSYFECMKYTLENIIDSGEPTPLCSFESTPHTLYMFDGEKWKIAELDTIDAIMNKLDNRYKSAYFKWTEANLADVNSDEPEVEGQALSDRKSDQPKEEGRALFDMNCLLAVKIGDMSYTKEAKLREVKRMVIWRTRRDDDENDL